MIKEKLQTLSKMVFDTASFSLFSELPLSELESIQAPVKDLDSIRSRLNDLCNIVDRIDKRSIDKHVGLKGAGSKQSLVYLLKKLLPQSHDQINESVERPLDIVFLVRAYFTHAKNKNIDQAFEYLQIGQSSVQDYAVIWEKVLFLFGSTVDSMIDLLRTRDTGHTQEKVDDDTREMLLSFVLKRFASRLKDPDIKKLMLYLLSENEIIDSTLASHFGMTTDSLRNCLLSVYPSFIGFEYHSDQDTLIVLQKEMIEPLRNFYFPEEQ